MAISKRVRFEVFKRDKFTCQYCGKRPPEVTLEADHILPKCEGGPDAIDNLTTACHDCNRGKSGIPLENVAPAVDEMERLASMQEMLERKQTIQRSAAAAKATADAEREGLRLIHEWWLDEFGEDGVVQDSSLRRFLREMNLEQIREAITSTAALLDRRSYMTQWRLWKYFCGTCWTMIRGPRVEE